MVDGVKTPAEETPVPVQIPPVAGLKSINVFSIGWLQRIILGPASTKGRGFIVIVLKVEFEHPVVEFVPVTV